MYIMSSKRKRLESPPSSLTGKFKDWDFDSGEVPKAQQVTYDAIPNSPTQGYILINSDHPINEHYFGENPTKAVIEESHTAQLYLAELILNESLRVIIPEAYQKGAISAITSRPEYDILQYIAEKKTEYGPAVYNHIVKKPSARENKLEEQIKDATQGGRLPLKDLLNQLEERHRAMVEMRFGLGDERTHTLDEIARKFGVTRERIRQIVNQALSKGDLAFRESEVGEKGVEKVDYIKAQDELIKGGVAAIIKVTADTYGVTEKQIYGRVRTAELVVPRQVAMYLVREAVGLSFPAIGKTFNRDHTTTLYAHKKIKEKASKDSKLTDKINSIIKQLKSTKA